MKRRFISILMALVMALSLLPAQALAEDNTVTELNKNNISTYVNNGLGNGTYKLSDDVEITGTLTITGDTTLDLNDHVLQMTGSGSVFKIEDGGHLTLEDNAATKTLKYFSKNNATDPWTLLTDSSTSAYSVSGGIITGGTGCEIPTGSFRNTYGGGVYVDGGGQFTMTGGNIVGCKAEGDIAYGGGVFVAKGGQFTMTGGSITGCTAVARDYGHAYGGGIRNDGEWQGDIGRTTLSGTAEIRDCHAKCANAYIDTSYGGGISDGGTLNISGDVTIIGCTDGGQGSDAMYINANNGSSVTGGTFYGSIQDPKNKISGHIVTYQVNGADYATQVVQSGETATAPTLTVPAGQTFDGWYKADGTKWNFTNDTVTESLTLAGWLYTPVASADDFTAAMKNTGVSTIRLKNDITLPRLNWSMIIRDNRQLTLDLNGYVLDLGENPIHVGGGSVGSMTIMDSRPNEPHKFTPNDDGLWVRDETNGDKIVKGGVITSSDSAIRVGGGKTIMNGGNIVGCRAGDGGAVSIVAGGQFTMNAGSIAGCKASGKGGGVYLLIGTFELAGGVIKSCKAGNKGGAVYVGNKDGIFTMTGGSIEGCKAANGSALCLYGKMEANGGTVDGTVVLDTKENHGTHTGIIQGSGTNATQFNGTVTNKGTISYGTFNGAVENTGTLTGGTYNGTVENTGTLTGGTYNGLIQNGNSNAKFGNVNSPLGIIGNKPGTDSSTYYKVTFAPADSTMDNTTRYFLENGTISDQIKPASRTGYTFGGWYKADGTAWDHTTDTVTGDLTLTAHWNKCDHSGHTGTQPTCTTGATCTVCGGTIAALEHAWGAWVSNNDNTHTRTCTRDNTHTETNNCADTNKDHLCDGCKQALTSCADNNSDHKCDLCGKVISNHGDANGDHECDICGKVISNHGDANDDHKCDLCGKVISNHGDANGDHKCDLCGKVISNHGDANDDHNCDLCGKVISNHADTNNDHVCDICDKVISNHADTNKDHVCDICGKVISNHGDANDDHKCDLCGKVISNHADANKDHVCDTCGATLTQHSGGTASCAAPATCGYCGKPYGEKNPANHSDLKHVPAKAATTQAEGNSEYWLCSGCGKCYKDAAAATEIALSDTVIAKRIPRRYSGPTITVVGAAYYDGGNVGLTFVSSADFDTFTGVQVDGKTLAAKNYIAERGSIEVYLKAVYLRTLKNGSHTVTIQSTAGDVSAVFTVENSKTSPGTSDPGVAVYALSSMLSLTGLAALRRRKED